MKSPPGSPVSKDAITMMAVVLGLFALVAIYGNVQRARRDKLEHTTITHTAAPTPSPTPP